MRNKIKKIPLILCAARIILFVEVFLFKFSPCLCALDFEVATPLPSIIQSSWVIFNILQAFLAIAIHTARIS